MYKVGIDLGGTNIKVGIVNEKQEILIKDSLPTNAQRPYSDIIRDMAYLVHKLLDEFKIAREEIVGIGIGNPGLVDSQGGVILYSNNINWDNVPVVQELKQYFDCEIRVSNDANCAALGEVKAGAAKDISNAILLTLGTGVGGGIVIDGKVFEGAHAGGAELGHTSLILGGESCTCGRKGCVEAYASATALIRDAKRMAERHPHSLMNQLCEGDLSNMNGKIPFDAALQEDEAAIQVINQYTHYLGAAIANYVNIFRPDVVLLSGGICNQKERLTNPISEYLKGVCFGKDKAYIPPVTCAILGNDAGIIGAANLIP